MGLAFGVSAAHIVARRAMAVAMVTATALSVCSRPFSAQAQLSAAGDTGAVLSFIDAAAGRVEIVRHWPQAPVDVDVYPFVPYFWTGCPGPGAIAILLTAPPVSSGTMPFGTSDQRGGFHDLMTRMGAALQSASGAAGALRHLASALRMPGDPVAESVKSLFPLIADLGTYERRGYAVFAFILWQGWRCGMTLRAVPEGYGVPFVR